MTYGLKDAFSEFIKENPEVNIDYFTYKNIIHDFTQSVVDDILFKGKKFYMFNRLSYLEIIRVSRNYNKPSINWVETWKARKQYNDNTIKIYHTTPWFAMIYWNKGNCIIENKMAYRFRFVRGEKGVVKKMVSLFEDELIHHKFRLVSAYKYVAK